jgi:hypothetical protein
MQWFRWYNGTINDPKFTTVARKSQQSKAVVMAVWQSLLEHASQHDGSIQEYSHEDVAAVLEIETFHIVSVTEAFVSRGMIDKNEIKNWGKRQYKSDNSTERVKKYRLNKSKDLGTDETFLKRYETACNGDETHQNRTEQSRTEQKQIDAEAPPSPVNKKSSARKKSVRDDSTNPYWITGKVIKLRKDDYDAWVGEFNRLGGPGIDKILFDRDDWLAEQHDGAQKMWYRTTYQYLKRLNSDQYAT